MLTLYVPSTDRYYVTMGGGVLPGTPGTTITHVTWEWGDGIVENHAIPHSHTYTSIGTYTITVTAHQSDGQSTAKSQTVYVSGPTETTTTTTTTTTKITTAVPQTTLTPTTISTTPAVPPVFALQPPRADNLSVIIEGSVLPGGPSVAIDAIEWDWGDGARVRSNEMPATHTYTAAGAYTITIVAFQNDGQTSTTTFQITLTQAPGTYGTPGTPMPNGSGLPFPTVRLFGINIFPLIVLLMVGLVVGGLLYFKSRQSTPPEIPTTDAIEQAAASYQEAKERGDLPAAKKYALDAARFLIVQADAVPKYSNAYLEKAEIWKEIARTIDDQQIAPESDLTQAPIPVPIATAMTAYTMNATGETNDVGTGPDSGGDLLEGTDVEPGVFDAVLRIALEIAREGREGKPVGTAFLIGDVDGVLAYSTQFILNPFKGHTAEERRITDAVQAENIKEFAQLDGAFVIGGDGIVEAAGRYITVDTSAVQIPPGLGSRHASVAGITLVTKAIGIVVSQSGGLIKIFKGGEIVRTVSPW
jgi:PKD repeat protein